MDLRSLGCVAQYHSYIFYKKSFGNNLLGYSSQTLLYMYASKYPMVNNIQSSLISLNESSFFSFWIQHGHHSFFPEMINFGIFIYIWSQQILNDQNFLVKYHQVHIHRHNMGLQMHVTNLSYFNTTYIPINWKPRSPPFVKHIRYTI